MWEIIYNLFKIKTDGEEFDSEDDALLIANGAYRKLLAIRDWIFLKKTSSITITSTSYTYSAITDLAKPLALWYGDYKLKKATFENRKDANYDYWIDYTSKKIMFINDYSGKTLDLDYKYRPDDISVSVDPVVEEMGPAIAFQMILDYYEKDQDNSVYQQASANLSTSISSLTDYNESLRT